MANKLQEGDSRESQAVHPEIKSESIWRHWNGNVYKVLAFANSETTNPDKYPVTVIYQNVKNKTLWSRPANDWHRSFTLEG